MQVVLLRGTVGVRHDPALRDTVELINLSDEYTRAEKRMMVKDLERGEEDLYNGMIRVFSAIEPD